MTKEAYIPQYKGDEPNDQGDLDTRFGNQEKHKRGGVKFNSKRSVDNIILEKHNKVKAGHKLTSGEVDTILDYAGDDRREAAFSVLRDHYNLYENIDNLTHRDILNIVAIRNYAEKENKEQWVNEFDEKLNKYFVGIDIPKDTVRELRENIFNERIHYEAVREGFENFEDKVSDHKAWQNIEDIDEKIDQEKRLYIYLSHPSISPSLSGYSTQDAPLIADGGLGEKFTGGFTGLISEAVEYGIERSSAATTEDLDNVEERLSSDIDHTNDLIDRNSRK